MKKLLTLALFTILVFNLVGTTAVFAQEAGTLLPETQLSKDQCDSRLNTVFMTSSWEVTKADGTKITTKDPRVYFASLDDTKKNDILGCAIITGRIKFWMVPFYIVYLVEFAIGISGLVAILFLVVGGFQYVVGGATEKQDQAKNTIMYALIGMVLVLSAWVLVNLLQFLLTI